MKSEIKVREEVVNYINGLDLLVRNTQDIIAQMIVSFKEDKTVIDSPAFEYYEQKCSNRRAEYEAAKGQLVEEYLSDKGNVDWRLDYTTGILTYEEV